MYAISQDLFRYLDILVYVEGASGAQFPSVVRESTSATSRQCYVKRHNWLDVCCAGTIYAMDEENERLAAEGRVDAAHVQQGTPLLLQGAPVNLRRQQGNRFARGARAAECASEQTPLVASAGGAAATGGSLNLARKYTLNLVGRCSC